MRLLDRWNVVRNLGTMSMGEILLVRDGETFGVARRIRWQLDESECTTVESACNRAQTIPIEGLTRVLAHGRDDAGYTFVEEAVFGASLSELTDSAPDGRLAPSLACTLIRDAAKILGNLHALRDAAGKPEVHRTIRPTRIRVDHRGEVKVSGLFVDWARINAGMTRT